MKNLMTICMVMVFVLAVSGTAKADLVSHWMFDEGSGTVAYDSIGLNDGTVYGASWTTGVMGGALEFDGVDDRVDCGNDESLNVTQATWGAWLNFAAKPSEAGHLMNPLAKQEQYWIHASSDDSIQSKISVGGTRYIATTGADFIETGVWYHVVGTYDGETLKLYVDGVLMDLVSITGDLNTSSVILAIGTWSSPTDYFEGTIDEVAIWDHALSTDEVMDVYINGVPRECVPAPSGMVGWWPGDGNADDIIGGNHGTLVGDAIFVSPGKVGDAFTFSGTGEDYVLIPNDTSLEPETVTVDAWVRADGSPGSCRYIVAKGASGCTAASYALYTGGGGLIFYVFNGSGVRSPEAGSGIWDNQWHHVAGTYDGEYVRLYVDGAEVGSGTPTNISIGYGLPTDNNLIIGQYAGTCSLPFRGDIDEVEIFNRALSIGEIQDIFYAGSAGKCIVVDIDIKPGSEEGEDNTISLDAGGGLIPVAIFSVCDENGGLIFDATTIDPATVSLEGTGVAVRGKGVDVDLMVQEIDVNGDGCIDLVIHIAVASLIEEGAIQDGEAILTGETYNGLGIVGWDDVTVVPVKEGE